MYIYTCITILQEASGPGRCLAHPGARSMRSWQAMYKFRALGLRGYAFGFRFWGFYGIGV